MAVDAIIRIAKLRSPDSDGDVVTEETWNGETGLSVPLLPSHNINHVPLGRAHVFARDGYARAHLSFNRTSGGRDWKEALRHDFADPAGPRAQFSYGFRLLSPNERITIDGRSHRWLRNLELLEVSVVLKGASVGSGVDHISEEKGMSEYCVKEALPYLHKAELMPRPSAPTRTDLTDPDARRLAYRLAQADEARILEDLRAQSELDALVRRFRALGVTI